jgi:dTDP-4-dehydrorhamnose 3,5-epimerase
MKFVDTPLPGVWLVAPEPLVDERGFFARTFCRREFEEHGLDPELVQASISFNGRKGTLRGMHYQAPPHEEGKLVRCTRGAIHDVTLDLRPDSPTYLEHFAARLDEDNRLALWVPPGVAHGFLTLTDGAEVLYQMSVAYVPDAARGVRWDDPAFGIDWPEPPAVISERDAGYPDFAP